MMIVSQTDLEYCFLKHVGIGKHTKDWDLKHTMDDFMMGTTHTNKYLIPCSTLSDLLQDIRSLQNIALIHFVTNRIELALIYS